MMNKLADDLGGVPEKSFPKVTGQLKVVSENPYCTSYQGIIQQFNDVSYIELILIDGAK